MCIALPGRVKEIVGDEIILDYDGVERVAHKTDFDVRVGDYVLAQAGLIIQKLDEREAEETLRVFRSLKP